jgi:hypothetical protein
MKDISRPNDNEKLPKIPREKDVKTISKDGETMKLPGQPLPYGVRKRFERNNSRFYENIDLAEYQSEDLSVIIDSGSSEESNRNRPNRIDSLKQADRDDDFITETLVEELQHAEDPSKILFGRFVFPEKDDLYNLSREDMIKLAKAAEIAGVHYFVVPPLFTRGHDLTENEIEEYIETCKEIYRETDDLSIIPTIYLGVTSGYAGKKFAQEAQELPEDVFEFIGGHVQYGMPLVKRKNGVAALLNHSDRKVAFVDVEQKVDATRKRDDSFGNVSREKAYALIGGDLVFRKRWVYGGGSDSEEDEEDENMELLRETGYFQSIEPGSATSVVDEIPIEDNQEYLEEHSSVPDGVESLHNDFAVQEVFGKLREDIRSSSDDSELWSGREHLEEAVATYSNLR